jgi:hypothetical protein
LGCSKSTAYAAQMVAQDACRGHEPVSGRSKSASRRVRGGCESAVRAMQAVGLEIVIATSRPCRITDAVRRNSGVSDASRATLSIHPAAITIIHNSKRPNFRLDTGPRPR